LFTIFIPSAANIASKSNRKHIWWRAKAVQLEGDVTIDAPREDVWNFLTAPHRVSKCAPGLESIDIIEPDKKFEAVASVGFGAIKTRLKYVKSQIEQ
jgi:carbon monoxide dehydrogenase subunit G